MLFYVILGNQIIAFIRFHSIGSETEKEFNLTVVYGADVDVATIINAAKRYPMMSEHQVVVVKSLADRIPIIMHR